MDGSPNHLGMLFASESEKKRGTREKWTMSKETRKCETPCLTSRETRGMLFHHVEGAGPTGAQSQRHYCSCRQCFSPLFRSFWSWGRRHQQSCTPETVNELAGDFNDSNSLDKGQVSQATQDQCCSEASSLSPDEACTMLALREGAVQRWGHSLLLSFPDRSLSNVTTMCSIYQMFTSAQQVLDQQFPSTLCPILGTWPEQTRQDIGQSLHTAHVEVKGAYVHVTWHDRDLNTHAPVPLRQRQLLQLTEAEAEAAEPAKEPPMEREATLALHQPSPSGSEPASPPPAAPELEQGLLGYGWSPGPEAQTAGPSACLGVCTPAVSAATEPHSSRRGDNGHLKGDRDRREEHLEEEMPPWEHHLERPPGHGVIRELFKKVVPHQCLGSVWSRRNRPGNEHLAPTVRATIAQFNAVASCIVTTCLGDPSMTARDRAVVVGHWIRVAKG
ncbi:ral guanine nucleotide dissociation stimulator-like [Mustela putorius furo]|uniref:Ral guanine nucleotide dissociation stimulator-like n=1 Tax=Mustela putorius furo TaxID=9669 RepID=A0A8U0V3Z5_MUSPF|nr:ral guanine nucleotide dissociation stimulator-like [Mustela putorius furo]